MIDRLHGSYKDTSKSVEEAMWSIAGAAAALYIGFVAWFGETLGLWTR